MMGAYRTRYAHMVLANLAIKHFAKNTTLTRAVCKHEISSWRSGLHRAVDWAVPGRCQATYHVEDIMNGHQPLGMYVPEKED